MLKLLKDEIYEVEPQVRDAVQLAHERALHAHSPPLFQVQLQTKQLHLQLCARRRHGLHGRPRPLHVHQTCSPAPTPRSPNGQL